MKIKKIMYIISLFFIIGILGEQIFAENKDTLNTFLNKVKARIQRLQKKSSPRVSTVAGVRGLKKEKEKANLYWKGKKGKKITSSEIDKFKEAIDLAQAEKKEEAIKKLEEFIKQYPKSEFISDAKEILKMLKEK